MVKDRVHVLTYFDDGKEKPPILWVGWANGLVRMGAQRGMRRQLVCSGCGARESDSPASAETTQDVVLAASAFASKAAYPPLL